MLLSGLVQDQIKGCRGQGRTYFNPHNFTNHLAIALRKGIRGFVGSPWIMAVGRGGRGVLGVLDQSGLTTH